MTIHPIRTYPIAPGCSCRRAAAGRLVLWVVLLVGMSAAPASAQWWVDLEGGAVFSGYNVLQIPRSTGTRVSLSSDFDIQGAAYYRLRVGRVLGPHASVSLLFAPLTLDASGTPAGDVTFEGTTFTGGVPLDATYTFNSYRATWQYRFEPKGAMRYALGFTAKIRDAAIRLDGDGQSAASTNVGFVPLMNFRVARLLKPGLELLLEGDALAAPQGRAEDVFLGVVWGPGGTGMRPSLWRFGYRIVEGGADVEKVYTFAAIHYVGLTAHWVLP